MFSRIVLKKGNELVNEISKEKNIFRMFTKAMELEGLIKYLNNPIQ